MPPRTRTKPTKVLKENIGVVGNTKLKSDGKVMKSSRKALADKTNSLSDDNASIDVPVKTSQKVSNKKKSKPNGNVDGRPKRQRRLPPRYIENATLKNLSNSQDPAVKPRIVTSKSEVIAKTLPLTESSAKTSENHKCLNKQETGKTLPSKSQLKDIELRTKSESIKSSEDQVLITAARPRRNRRTQPILEDSSKDSLNVTSPFKTPSKNESSLIANRPKRVCRLPSKFEDHSISPNKFIPVQPCHASTPIVKKTTKVVSKVVETTDFNSKIPNNTVLKAPRSKAIETANTSNSSIDTATPDTNNNGKNENIRPKRATFKTKVPTKQVSPDNKVKPFNKRLLDKSLSFRVLEDKKSKSKQNGVDVYEFTFDPNEEPPAKKKKKRPAKARPAKPKPKKVVLKSNYDDNVSKALANLKAKVKPSQTKTVQNNDRPIQNVDTVQSNKQVTTNHKSSENLVKPTENAKFSATDKVQNIQPINEPTTNTAQSNYSANMTPHMPAVNESVNSIHVSNYASIRVEDIAADFEFSNHDDINYSPVNSPHQQITVDESIPKPPEPNKTVDPVNEDPLNLRDDESFFGDTPVASSSMNASIRHPLASPWRVEFGSLPMKWHNNTYVKANMTPAVESSFVNSEAAKKKHVYTNIVQEDEPLPEIFDATPALKQTSIISFIKEVAERKANKKKRRRSQSPTRTAENVGTKESHVSPQKAKLTKKDLTPNTSNNINTSKDKENSTSSSNKSISPQKKKKDKDCTYFGFDESEIVDQENVSPVKVKASSKPRVLRSRNVLHELNTQAIPMRAVMPVSGKAKLTSSEVVEQLYDQLKSTEDAQFPVKEPGKEPAENTVVSNVDNPSWQEDNDDSQSVHLFEDIEVVHHMKPHRKSYGKTKKVVFQQTTDSDSDTQPIRNEAPGSSDEDDLADLSFHLPDVKQTQKRTKKKPKKLLTKKEEKEAEEWAAGFNSMCEDIDEFPLVVE